MKKLSSLLLISASPRRRNILERFVPHLKQLTPNVDERPVKVISDLKLNACEKMKTIGDMGDFEAAVSADTCVFLSGEAIGKPETQIDAIKTLHMLSGASPEVVTALCLNLEGEIFTTSITTIVHFRKLSSEIINAYVSTGEPIDKAGAFGIQGFGAILIEGIEGDYFNVVGLPIPALESLLNSRGYTLMGACD